MSITTVNGTFVDCHMCRTSTQHADGYEAHAFAAVHANQHMQPAPAPVQPQVVVNNGGNHPRYAKTTINHTPHIILDLITFGFWIPVHITLAILGGRKTRFK